MNLYYLFDKTVQKVSQIEKVEETQKVVCGVDLTGPSRTYLFTENLIKQYCIHKCQDAKLLSAADAHKIKKIVEKLIKLEILQ